jgi:hypothetical protein
MTRKAVGCGIQSVHWCAALPLFLLYRPIGSFTAEDRDILLYLYELNQYEYLGFSLLSSLHLYRIYCLLSPSLFASKPRVSLALSSFMLVISLSFSVYLCYVSVTHHLTPLHHYLVLGTALSCVLCAYALPSPSIPGISSHFPRLQMLQQWRGITSSLFLVGLLIYTCLVT